MRFSEQARKILLLLRRARGRRTTKELAGALLGDEAFYAEGKYLFSSNRASLNRTLNQLLREGYVERTRPYLEMAYSLTDKGVEKAEEIKSEILDFIKTWGALVADLN